MKPLLPAFLLRDSSGADRSFPSGRPTLIVMVKEDCPTCGIVMPLLEAFFRSYGVALDVLVVGQTQQGNAILIDRHRLTCGVLDDSRLKVSFAYDVEMVPAVFVADAQGSELLRVQGFDRAEWQQLDATLAKMAGVRPAPVDWAQLPLWRPGCGSLSVDPRYADRLRAEAENSPLRARKIEIAPADDEFEFMFDQGFTDGLPVVPPTPERVIRMLTGTRRDPQQIVALVPPNMGEATVEKIAINAV
ncbi:MAG: TlpA family protein disulfide reductase, partial [Proteobacteria bacterium]|nr:TlpA family protein disulfide reductase [Pseudomonadota bacterium]